MFINKNFTVKGLWRFSGHHLIWISLWTCIVTFGIEYLHSINIYAIQVPMLPLTIIGTAVAFYVGFKNNSAYDRLWEARKIWGAIVNSSRIWGSNVKSYVSDQFVSESQANLEQIHKRLIYILS